MERDSYRSDNVGAAAGRIFDWRRGLGLARYLNVDEGANPTDRMRGDNRDKTEEGDCEDLDAAVGRRGAWAAGVVDFDVGAVGTCPRTRDLPLSVGGGSWDRP